MSSSAHVQKPRKRQPAQRSKGNGAPIGSTASEPVSSARKRSFWPVIFRAALCIPVGVCVYFLFTLWSGLRSESRHPLPVHTNKGTYVSGALEVRELPGRGKGVMARRNIQPGELLFRERPLLHIPMSIRTDPVSLIADMVQGLTSDERALFYNLSYVNMPAHLSPGTAAHDLHIPFAIFQTNVVAAGDGAVGLFPHMARLNHACAGSFNAVYSWREEEDTLVVYAIEDVAAGEEVLTTYFNTMRPRSERQQHLEHQYAFTCSCATCSLDAAGSAASDARLDQMVALYNSLASWGFGAISARAAVDIARKIWEIGEVEGYVSGRARLVADVVHVAAASSDGNAVREWAQLAARYAQRELGDDSALAAEMRAWVQNPQAHPMWGTAVKESVGVPGNMA